MSAWARAAPIANSEPPTRNAPAETAFALRSAESLGVRAGAMAGLEAGDRRQVVFAQLEIEEIEVGADPLRGHRLRDHHVAQLQVPTQDHLGDGRLMVGGD